MSLPSFVDRDVPLAPRTTLNVGGASDYLAEITDLSQLPSAIAFARMADLPIGILGGGSNLLVSDDGFRGLMLQLCTKEWSTSANAEGVDVHVAAGQDWDAFVDFTVSEGLAGVECLTGIPGNVGAAPIQNIGAYGQEVGDVIRSVDVLDLETGQRKTYGREECQFEYRNSVFKRTGGHHLLVLGLTLRMTPGGRPTVRYAELQRRVAATASLDRVRAEVRTLRASKSMLANGDGPNRQSAGSFFLNPVVSNSSFAGVQRASERLGLSVDTIPHWRVPGGVKLAAAWLIDQAGYSKGYGSGRVGLSTHHTLALVNRGGASASELIEFALHIRSGVERVFGLQLVPEPRMVGFSQHPFESAS